MHHIRSMKKLVTHAVLIGISCLVLLAGCSEEPTYNVSYTGMVVTNLGRTTLAGCDLTYVELTGSLRDSVSSAVQRASSTAPVKDHWITIEATDTTYSQGRVVEMHTESPCPFNLPGHYSQDAANDGDASAKLLIGKDGRFNFALAPGDGSRIDREGTWTQDGESVLLKTDDKAVTFRVIRPSTLLLQEPNEFGLNLRLRKAQ
jgi:hypothetical protein